MLDLNGWDIIDDPKLDGGKNIHYALDYNQILFETPEVAALIVPWLTRGDGGQKSGSFWLDKSKGRDRPELETNDPHLLLDFLDVQYRLFVSEGAKKDDEFEKLREITKSTRFDQ